MTEQQLYRRLVRRSSHRSRSAIVVVVLVIVALAALYAGTECVLAALGRPALFVTPADALAFTSPLLGLVAVPGLILVIVALTPGRRGRHELPDERMAVVVDDEVLAGAVKHATIRTARLPADRVQSSMTRRRSSVRITPTSGQRVDAEALTAAATTVVDRLDPRPPVRVAVTVAESAVVGS